MEGCVYFICEVINKMEIDIYIIFLGKVLDGDIFLEDNFMIYLYYYKVVKGKSFKNVLIYILEDVLVEKKSEKYVCSVCGYVYEGDIFFEELLDDYICLICK